MGGGVLLNTNAELKPVVLVTRYNKVVHYDKNLYLGPLTYDSP